mgnify:FL=1
MKRRDFLRAAVSSSLVYGLGSMPGIASSVLAQTSAMSLTRNTFVNVMLEGAPDFRHLMPPAYSSDQNSYGYQFWKAKATAHSLSATDSNAWANRWDNDYFHLSSSYDNKTVEFGLSKEAVWLKKMWDKGNLAVINNVAGGIDRNHAHCQMQLNQGNTESHKGDRPGWGGRLVRASSGNVVSLTTSPADFCFSPDGDNWQKRGNDNIIAASNTREMGLYKPQSDDNSRQAGIARSLEGYYQAKQDEMSSNSLYRRFVEQEAEARFYGDLIDERLADHPVPMAIEALYTEGALTELADFKLAPQIRNLYDSILCNDIMDMRVASMLVGGWDTHKDQKMKLESLFTDLFGEGRAFDALQASVPTEVSDKMVFMFAGEFGRQLKANGDAGTDHGRGTSYLLVGENVRGGIYGDMYPEEELSRLGDKSPDINGLTSLEHVLAEVSNWVQPGSSSVVFPKLAEKNKEQGLDLTLFS